MIKRFVRWVIRTAITLAVIAAIVIASDYVSHRIASDSVLVVRLTGPVVERGSNGVLGLLNAHETPLNYVRSAIDRAIRDDRISGLVVKIIDPDMDLGQAQELAAMIQRFRKSGKWTAAYIETAGEFDPGNLPILVASAAGEVSIMPQGELNLVGVGVREMFARGTLDWLGIRPDFAAIGQYKSAANIFTEKDFTPGQREEDTALVNDLYEQIVDQIAAERHLAPAAVSAIVDQSPIDAAQGLKAKLVDRLEYEDQFDHRVKNRGGVTHQMVSYANYTRSGLLSSIKSSSDRIAVVYGVGAIERGQGGFDPLLSPGGSAMGSDDIVQALKQARDDDSVRAVVFRIDSPGGSVIASELIRREVEITAKKKPLVVSMAGYGASGGYWVSTPAAKIIAEPGTITGSIGVLGGKFNIAPATQKIFLNTGAITRGANVEMFDMFTDFTPAQAAMFKDQLLGNTYQEFLKIVAQGRKMTVDQVNQVAQGRVWTGKQALPLKLVDSLGGFDDALAAAKKLAGLPPEQAVALEELPQRPGILQQLLSGRINQARALGAGPVLSAIALDRILRAALEGHGGFGAAYCPVIPMM
jgi:protease IV